MRTAIATITLARRPGEVERVIHSLEALNGLGVPVFAADGGSLPEFVERADKLRNVRLWREGNCLVAQVQAALRRTLEQAPEVVIYTEPDKKVFFETGMRALIDRGLSKGPAGLTLPSRDEPSMATFPRAQIETERVFNQLAARHLGLEGDYLYGPMAIGSSWMREQVDALEDSFGWGWRTFVIARCVTQGGTIDFQSGYFPNPDSNTQGEDESLYRLAQLVQNLHGLHSALAG